MIRQLFILLIMLAWSIALLATILPAFPVKDFTGVRKAATRSDDNRMGAIATLRYEKLSDMKMPRMNSQTFATANGLMIAGSQSRGVDIYNPQYNSFPSVPNLSKARAIAKAINVNEQIFVAEVDKFPE